MLRRDAKVELLKRVPLFAGCSKKELGEIALVSSRPRTATVTATAPVRLLVVTDRAFRELMQNMPSIQMKVLTALADRLAADVS